MSEIGTLLKNYILPIVAIFSLILSIIGAVFVVVSMVACVKSTRFCKSRVEQMNWRLKSTGYIKIWTLIFAIVSFSGVIIGLLISQRVLMYGNLFLGILFLIFYAVMRQTYQLMLNEFNLAQAILGTDPTNGP